jgi:hypothetical protein
MNKQDKEIIISIITILYNFIDWDIHLGLASQEFLLKELEKLKKKLS